MSTEQTDAPAADAVAPTLMDDVAVVETPAAEAAPAVDDNKTLLDAAAEEPTAEGEAEEPKAENDKPEGAPEEYTDFTAPEGVELDTEMLSSFKEFAKADNLSQAQAQKYIDLATGIVANQQDAFSNAMTETVAGWREASVSDKEFGGAQLQASMQIAATARDRFASPELKTYLNESRLGDHPEVLRMFVNIGKAISEDTFVQSGKAAREVNFYDHPTSKKTA